MTAALPLTSSLTAQIGNTPLLHLRRLEADFAGAELYAKAEWFNPGGSVKDRAAWSMLLAAERAGTLTPDRVILEATSGNTGIALAMLAAARGYAITLCLPENASRERRLILQAYGAQLILTPAAEGTDGAIFQARALAAADPGRYCYLDQYSNPANWQAHYYGTAVEIWRQTRGRITHFVATLGTSGTFTGVARRLKEFNPAIVCVAIQPDGPFHGLEGMKHMGSALVPAIYDPALADLNLPVATEAAYHWVRRLAREEGWRAGVSSGAALAGCHALVHRLTPAERRQAVVVTVFPDNADKYLSERFWEEA